LKVVYCIKVHQRAGSELDHSGRRPESESPPQCEALRPVPHGKNTQSGAEHAIDDSIPKHITLKSRALVTNLLHQLVPDGQIEALPQYHAYEQRRQQQQFL
jgi:hypothetical protein